MQQDSLALPQQYQNTEVDDDSIDLRQLWHTLLRHRWAIVSLPILVMMLTFLAVSSMTPIYKATTSMLIEPDSANVVDIEQVYGLTGGNREYLQTQFELLKSRSLAEDVVRNLRLDVHPEFDPRQQQEPAFNWRAWLSWRTWVENLGLATLLPVLRPEDLREQIPSEEDIIESVVNNFKSRIEVEPVRNTQLVAVSIEMADPRLAARAANALAEGYIDRQLSAKLDMTRTAASWMTKRLEDLRANLRESERRLQEFREQENLVDVEGVATVSEQGLGQLSSRLIEARQSLTEAENQYRQIESVTDAGWQQQVTVPIVLSHELVSQFRADETRARAKVDDLSKRYGYKHPTMIEARNELNSAVDSLRTQVEQVVAGIERNYQLAKANLNSLQQTFEENKGEVQEVQRVEFGYRELLREVETNRTLYDTFMTRLKETSATADLDTANARLVDRAIVPKSPVKPQKRKITLIAGILALMAAVGLALLREQLDNRVRGSGDVQEKLKLPVLGLLPLQRKDIRRETLARMFLDDTDRSFSESVRTIRTGVVLSGLDNPHKIIVVTSTVPGEGKTSVATNLAFALGQMEKVLLIEADMRKPTFHRIFELPAGTPGLANVAAGSAKLDQAIQRIEDIDVMSCGTIPPNPLELLSSHRFSELIDQLDAAYDRIVIDAPPVHAVSDPLVLATKANSLIYVVKTEATPVPMIQKGLEQLRLSKAPVTGVVLNHVDVKKSKKYGYGYSYRYGYGGYYDYYGYSKGDKDKASA